MRVARTPSPKLEPRSSLFCPGVTRITLCLARRRYRGKRGGNYETHWDCHRMRRGRGSGLRLGWRHSGVEGNPDFLRLGYAESHPAGLCNWNLRLASPLGFTWPSHGPGGGIALFLFAVDAG